MPFFFDKKETKTNTSIYYSMIKWTNDTTNVFKISTADNRKVAQGTPAYFAIEIVHDMTKETFFLYSTLSQITGRYVKLSIGEPNMVNLKHQGFYTYKIWETSNNTYNSSNYTSNLDDDDLVHKGKLYFDDTANTEVKYTTYKPTSNTNTTNANTVYLTI